MIEKRIVIIYVGLLCATAALLLRLSGLTQGSDTLVQAATVQSSYALRLGEARGMIYDRRLKPLVNQKSYPVLSVAPTPEAMTALRRELPPAEFAALLPLLGSGKPVLLRPSKSVSGSGIEGFRFPVRYSTSQLAPHLIGYLNGSGKGVTGIEAGYDQLLADYGGQVRTRYHINALGMALGEQAAEVLDTRPVEPGGLVLTLDRAVQAIAEDAAQAIRRGAVVVMEVQTGELLALVSRPDFDPNNVGASLNSPHSPLFNRALAAYSLGSIFKLSMAAAALEKGYTTGYSYVCPGYYALGEQRYYCHQRAGHWELDMGRALEQSCNPYFINLGQRLGSRCVCETAEKLGFGTPSQLAEGLLSVSGSLPDFRELDAGGLANLSFGQGALTATPVQVARLVATIANGGMSYQPTLYRGVTADGNLLTPAAPSPGERVLSPATAQTLRELMLRVVETGSGKKAQPTYGSAGGKTSTAQTGVYRNGLEVVHGWFAGFYPAQAPRYAIVVLEEGGGDGSATPAKVFGGICNEIALQGDFLLRRAAK